MRPSIPNKYSEERVSTILLRIRYGCSQKKAAEYAGVSEQTLYCWRKRYPKFDAAVREAIEEARLERELALSHPHQPSRVPASRRRSRD